MRQRCILLVDDQPVVLDVTTRILKSLSYEVTAMLSAEAALVTFRAGLFGLVITDLEMPGMNGIALARKLKALQPAIPVILYTTAGEMYPVVDLVLAKPGRRADFLAAITQLLPREA